MEGGFLITTASNATPGTAYGPLTLTTQDAGISVSPYVTTLKWTHVTMLKGSKLSSVGVLSGTPNKKLIAGTISVTVQVTETVTNLNGKKKVKTKTTVQATIPLTCAVHCISTGCSGMVGRKVSRPFSLSPTQMFGPALPLSVSSKHHLLPQLSCSGRFRLGRPSLRGSGRSTRPTRQGAQ